MGKNHLREWTWEWEAGSGKREGYQVVEVLDLNGGHSTVSPLNRLFIFWLTVSPRDDGFESSKTSLRFTVHFHTVHFPLISPAAMFPALPSVKWYSRERTVYTVSCAISVYVIFRLLTPHHSQRTAVDDLLTLKMWKIKGWRRRAAGRGFKFRKRGQESWFHHYFAK